jgi:signal transduction histidine kinase
MTAAPTPAIRKPHNGASTALSAAESGPAITIDLDLAEIVAANTSGARALDLFAYASFPIALDAATPALARLREMTALGNANGKSIERLTFWSNGKLKPVLCTVTRQADRGSGMLVLRIIDEDGVEPSSPTAARSARALGQSPPENPQGAAETLKSMARRMREGDGVEPFIVHNGVDAFAADNNVEPSSALPPAAEPPAAPPPTSPARLPASVLDPDHLAKLAHELKTPLTAIAAAAEIMRDERLGTMGNERYLSYAADIHESATHALDVITSLLSESAKSNAAMPRLIALDLNAIVERTVSSLQALAQSQGLTLAFESEKSRPHVAANPTSLRQILLNLLTNAIKFTPRGGDVRVVTGFLADDRVFLAVRDTGCGIGDKTVEAAPPAAEHQQSWLNGGNGIGLPLVQRLVREMGAEFEIDSEPGKGTVVLIAIGGFARWSQSG